MEDITAQRSNTRAGKAGHGNAMKRGEKEAAKSEGAVNRKERIQRRRRRGNRGQKIKQEVQNCTVSNWDDQKNETNHQTRKPRRNSD